MVVAGRWWLGLESSQRLPHAQVWQVGPHQGLSAGAPSCGLSLWPGFPYSMTAGYQEESGEATLPLWSSIGGHATLLLTHSTG